MLRICAILAVVLMVVTTWTGSPAHASQRFDCITVASQTAEHARGDRDEAPSKSEKSVTHHHAGCNGHQLGETAHAQVDPDLTIVSMVRPELRYRGAEGLAPDAELRPPIA